MRLITIWTIPAMSMFERIRRTADWADLAIARKLPRRIQYWVVMVVLGKITATGPFATRHPMGLTIEEILSHLPKGTRS